MGEATSKVLPKGAWSGGGDGGHTLLLPGSALEVCGLQLRRELGAVPGGGHPKQGDLGIGGVPRPCYFSGYLCFIILWNLNDTRFHCNRFGTMRNGRCKYLPVSSESRRGSTDGWGVLGDGLRREWMGEEQPCLPRLGK